MSGLQADARNLVEHARVECQNHAFHYAEPLRVESCTQAICDLALRFGETGDDEESVMSRPFGVALLIAGFDEDGPQLYVGPWSFLRCPSVYAFLFLPHSYPSYACTDLFQPLDTTPSRPARSTDTTRRLLDPEARVRRRSCRMNTTVL